MPLYDLRSRPYLLKAAAGTSSSTLNTETICGWVNVPANALGTLGSLAVDMIWGFTNGGGTGAWECDIRVITGTSNGTTAGTSLIGATMAVNTRGRMSLKLWNNGATNAQIMANTATTSFTLSTNTTATAAIDTTAAFTLSLNCKVTNNALDVATLARYEAIVLGAG